MEVFPVLSRSNNIGDENGMHADAGLSNFLYKDATILEIGDFTIELKSIEID